MSDDLTTRVDHLETQIRRLLHLADIRRDPFVYLMVDISATRRQEKEIHDLLNAIEKQIGEGLEADAVAFEMGVGEIMGKRGGDHALADSIVRACEETDRYGSVVRALKASEWLG
jgi:hypothetical protein